MFEPHKPITKPASPLTEIPDFGKPEELLLQDRGYGRRPMLFEFRFSKQGQVSLYVASDRKPTSRTGGHGYDKKGVAFAGWFCKTFAAELKALFDQPKFQKQLTGASSGLRPNGKRHEWYCTYRDAKTGAVSINGMSGLDNVIEIMQRAFGLDLRYIGETNDSTLYMMCPFTPVKKTRKPKVTA
jgi:hypothetical protein